MKKLIALVMAAVMLMALAACNSTQQNGGQGGNPGDNGKYVIGICQFIRHPALDEATQGFIDAVEKGLGKENVTIKNSEAAGEPTNCTSIISGYVASGVDLIMANATPAVTAAANATSVIPILGTSVTEYGVALEIDDFDGLVGYNVSGTSDLADLDKQAQMIIDWCPSAKNIGLVYCNAEANSKYQVDVVQKYLEGKGLTCRQFGFADSNEMANVVTTAADWSDAIYVPTDNTVANNADAINDICLPKKVPIIAGEAGICRGCGIATLSISYYELGYTTGEMAVKILKGEEKIEEMEIQYAPNVTPMYNEEICTALGIRPLDGYQKLDAE